MVSFGVLVGPKLSTRFHPVLINRTKFNGPSPFIFYSHQSSIQRNKLLGYVCIKSELGVQNKIKV